MTTRICSRCREGSLQLLQILRKCMPVGCIRTAENAHSYIWQEPDWQRKAGVLGTRGLLQGIRTIEANVPIPVSSSSQVHVQSVMDCTDSCSVMESTLHQSMSAVALHSTFATRLPIPAAHLLRLYHQEFAAT